MKDLVKCGKPEEMSIKLGENPYFMKTIRIILKNEEKEKSEKNTIKMAKL